MIDDQNREIIIETTDLETFLKVSAFDVITKREVMLMMPRDSTQEQITYLARKKLLYVLNKELASESPDYPATNYRGNQNNDRTTTDRTNHQSLETLKTYSKNKKLS